MTDLQYPIGRFIADAEVTEAKRRGWIEELTGTAAMFRQAVAGLTPEQLDTPYRPGGWTVRQVVHHMPDSHTYVYIRFRLALTESDPTIKGYDAAAWAELADSRTGPVETSIALLGALHDRWVLVGLFDLPPLAVDPFQVLHAIPLSPSITSRNVGVSFCMRT